MVDYDLPNDEEYLGLNSYKKSQREWYQDKTFFDSMREQQRPYGSAQEVRDDRTEQV